MIKFIFLQRFCCFFSKIYFFLVFFSLSSLSFAQNLPTFTLNVTATAETCPGNGALSFSVSGNDATATMTYYVYKGPDYTTPVSITTANNVAGLTNGNYRVVATQSKTGFQSNSQTWNGSIANNKLALTYSTVSTNEICGNDARITVNITNGNVASGNAYTLFNSSGSTVVRGSQSSNVFSGLAGGTYLVSVKDSCGQNVTQTVSITTLTPNINFFNSRIRETSSNNCKIAIDMDINSGSVTNVVHYPIQVQVTTFDSAGNQIDQINETKTGTDYTSATNYRRYSHDIPYLVNVNYSLEYKITDACGNVFLRNVPINIEPGLTIRKLTACGGSYFTIQSNGFNNPIHYTVTGSGTAASYGTQTFNDVPNNPFNGDITIGSAASPIPDGTYTITAMDNCGHAFTTNYTLTTTNSSINSSSTGPGCTVGMTNIGIYAPSGITLASATLTSYPVDYSGPVTATIGSADIFERFNIIPSGTRVAMNNVPTGIYAFQITDTCGKVYNISVNSNNPLTHGNLDIEQVLNCDSFDLNVNVTGDNADFDKYFLERFNSSTGSWSMIAELVNGSLNGSYTQEGKYRIRKTYSTKGIGLNGNWWYDNGRNCEDIIKTFTYSHNQLSFESAYQLSCSNGALNLYVSGTSGVAPYSFQIIEKSGDPAFVPINPTSNTANDALFTSIPNGVYKVRVTDSCLNTKDNWIDLSALSSPQIEASAICDGQNGFLSIKNNPYITYEWTKDNDPTVLSTDPVLNFSPFNASSDSGTYFLHITSNVPASCIEQTLTFTVDSNPSNPNAGPDVNANVCDTEININLNTFLNTGADQNGTWEEITPSNGNLVGSSWSPNAAGTGNYQFTYKVEGLCSGEDTAVYNIKVDSCGVCYVDANTSSAGIDSKFGITLLKRADTNNGNWPMIRKSAHIVLESNTKGFVITRMPTSDLGNITDPVEGMMIYDTTEKCLKIYDGSQWSCFNKPACP